MKLEYELITKKIIGSALQVHRKLGPGFLESIYENALAIEFKNQKIKFNKQYEIKIKYNDFEIGKHRLDFLIENTIVLELKAIKEIKDIHCAIVRSYLKSINKKHGLIINFNKKLLDIRRIIYS